MRLLDLPPGAIQQVLVGNSDLALRLLSCTCTTLRTAAAWERQVRKARRCSQYWLTLVRTKLAVKGMLLGSADCNDLQHPVVRTELEGLTARSWDAATKHDSWHCSLLSAMYARWVLLQVLLQQEAPPALLRGTLLWFEQLVLLLSRHQYLSQTLFWRQHSVSWPSESSLRAFLVTHSEHLTLSDFARLLHAACLDRYDEITARRLVLTDHQWLETSSKYLQSIEGRALVPPALPAFVRHLVTFVGELQSLLIAACNASSESWPAGVYPSL